MPTGMRSPLLDPDLSYPLESFADLGRQLHPGPLRSRFAVWVSLDPAATAPDPGTRQTEESAQGISVAEE